MAATARLIVMMEQAEKARLDAQAAAAHLSTAELVRRRLFGREEPAEEAFLQLLAELGPLVRQACRTIDANLAATRAARENAEARDARVADQVRRELTDGDLAAVAEHLALAPRSRTRRERA